MCVWDGMGWLVCVCLASFLSWLHCGLGLYGNGSIGCTNNNYASREKCKKCFQPKEIAAMPTIVVPGASLQTYAHYFARAPGGAEQKMNIGLGGNGAVQQLFLSSNWSLAGTEKYGVIYAASWPLAGNHGAGVPYDNPAKQAPSVMKEWRNGDWICNCGFHNYFSRAQCKKCNAPPPPGYTTLGTKRLASEEFVHEWDNKRLNSGHVKNHFLTIGPQKPCPGFEQVGFEQVVGSHVDVKTGVYAPYAAVSSVVAPNWQAPMPFPYQATVPALIGKGAKQWRDGDWMCTNCNNHRIMHLVQSVIGARLKERRCLSQSALYSCKTMGASVSQCGIIARPWKLQSVVALVFIGVPCWQKPWKNAIDLFHSFKLVILVMTGYGIDISFPKCFLLFQVECRCE